MEYVNVEIAGMVIPTMAFVMKFLPSTWVSQLGKRSKMILAVLIGVCIAVFMQYKDPALFADIADMLIVGFLSGGDATGAYGSITNIAKKARKNYKVTVPSKDEPNT